jgi:hypothetical protein
MKGGAFDIRDYIFLIKDSRVTIQQGVCCVHHFHTLAHSITVQFMLSRLWLA